MKNYRNIKKADYFDLIKNRPFYELYHELNFPKAFRLSLKNVWE